MNFFSFFCQSHPKTKNSSDAVPFSMRERVFAGRLSLKTLYATYNVASFTSMVYSMTVYRMTDAHMVAYVYNMFY